MQGFTKFFVIGVFYDNYSEEFFDKVQKLNFLDHYVIHDPDEAKEYIVSGRKKLYNKFCSNLPVSSEEELVLKIKNNLLNV
jgi:hypothetical protein